MRFLISVTDELHDQLKTQAKQKGYTLSGLIRKILWEWVEKGGNTGEQSTANRQAHKRA